MPDQRISELDALVIDTASAPSSLPQGLTGCETASQLEQTKRACTVAHCC
jgi:hypothetical protein